MTVETKSVRIIRTVVETLRPQFNVGYGTARALVHSMAHHW